MTTSPLGVVTVDEGPDLGDLAAQVELLQEALVDAQIAADDRGWSPAGGGSGDEFTREQLRSAAKVARTMAVVNPLIRRGLMLRISYVWGSGVQISARAGEDDPQDVNAVVQAFLDDDLNQAAFTGSQAREELERALGTDGNVFLAHFTEPAIGRVQVRSIRAHEVDDVITNPDDADDPWFYKRSWTQTVIGVDRTAADRTGERTTKTSTEQRTAYYPALGYRPALRPRTIDGHDVLWDAPVLHVSVNRLDGWKFGIGDAYAATFWARAYKTFLEDWAQLVRALSRFAWHAQAKTVRGRTGARTAFRPAAAVNPATGESTVVGGAAVTDDNTTLTAIPKTGATIDSNSGRPLAAMVAAGLDVPVTMLLGDPGQEGARAVAETLDQPTELAMRLRRQLWESAIRASLGYVIDQAVKAPGGPLQGTVRVDRALSRERVELANDVDSSVQVDWPDLGKEPIDVLVAAIVAADSTGTLPPEMVAQLLMQALGVSDIDEVLAAMLDVDGSFIAPAAAQAATAAQGAAEAALRAVRDGDYPTDRS